MRIVITEKQYTRLLEKECPGSEKIKKIYEQLEKGSSGHLGLGGTLEKIFVDAIRLLKTPDEYKELNSYISCKGDFTNLDTWIKDELNYEDEDDVYWLNKIDEHFINVLGIKKFFNPANVTLTLKKVNKDLLPYQYFENNDHNVMKQILTGIGGVINPETIGFLYAWRQSESSLGSEERYFCNNPFSTTWDMDPKGVVRGSKESKMYTRTNSHGVKSYKNIEDGVTATIRTIIKNYPKIVESLKSNNLNCLQIAEKSSTDLDRWGSGGNHVKSICKKYLSGSKPNPRPINRGEGCY
jgi:hypothetical protein